MGNESTSDTQTYWASHADSRKAVAGGVERVKRYRESLRASGRADRMRRNWLTYLGWGPRSDADASRMLPGGEQGEMVQMTVNHFGAMVTQAVTLTTSNKPAVKAIAANSDFESLAQAQLAEALNDYYDRELAVSDREYEAALCMVLLSEAWVVVDWDATAGQEYTVGEDGRPVRAGDVRLYSLTPFDVATDPDAQDVESLTWFAWRRRANKWDLAAQYPKHRDALLSSNLSKIDNTYDTMDERDNTLDLRRKRMSRMESDVVYVWELRHLPTPSLPNGRRLLFVNQDVVLADSVQQLEDGTVNDYGYPFGDGLFAYNAAPERVPGLPDGHTSFFDLLSLQEGLDLSASIMASAINAGGMQNLYVPRGANITADKLTGSLNVIEYDGGERPVAESNLSINPAVSAWADMCLTWMRQRVSLNDVVAGEPSKGMPAQAMALLRAQAVEFHSRLQAAYERLVQRTRTGILKMLQRYAKTERVALVAGKANSWTLKHFTRDAIKGVDRFVVEPVNPVLKTLAGKVAFAQPLLDGGRIGVQEYLQLISTGRMEPVLRFAQDNQARIQREKEMLMQGIGLPPTAMGPMGPVIGVDGLPAFIDDGQPHLRPLISDTHWLDIPEYLSVLAMPEVRDNPAVVEAVTGVIDYKLQLWRQMDPALIMVLKGQLPPPPAMMGGMPPEGPGGPAGGPPSEAGPVGEGAPGELAGPPGAPPTRMPQPPPNPITGEQSNVPPPGV
jgi:hypothetical protein